MPDKATEKKGSAIHPHDARRIERVVLDRKMRVRYSPAVEHELRVALYDLAEDNRFDLGDGLPGPYVLHLGVEDNRLIFDVRDAEGGELTRFNLPLTPFRSVIRDYFTVCDSYYAAIKSARPTQIEAIDMGRRGLHNEGAALLRERLSGRAAVDEDTARRLFTLLCVLHIRG
jgi:uncharacterized protein (UPF0262 family)